MSNTRKEKKAVNKSKIEWCDHTYNPITGCRHGCHYCYAKTMADRFSGNVRKNKMAKDNYTVLRPADGKCDLYILDEPMKNETGSQLVYPFGFEPTLHRYRFANLDKLKNGNNIFVGAMADVFGDWVPDEWIDEVIRECEKRPQHNYLFLTKNPQRYQRYGLPKGNDNMWFGTSITTIADMYRIDYLPAGCKTFLSIEPLIEDIEPETCDALGRDVDWVIIGAETGRRKGKILPTRDWITRIVLVADAAGIPVFMKDSLIEIVGEENMRREFPEELTRKVLSEKLEDKLFDSCCICKQDVKKSDAIKILAKQKRTESAKLACHMCVTCFENTCGQWEIEIPDLEYRREK